MRIRHSLIGGSFATIAASSCLGAVTYLTQDRSITAATSFDGGTQTLVAPDFGSFVQTINLSTAFPGLNNTVGLNEAVAGIDCHLDPNKIKASGRLLARGGMTADGTTVATGSAQATVRATFRLDSASAFQLIASPRPLAGAKDKFKLKIESDSGVVFSIDESTTPSPVLATGNFAAGDYSLEYQIELTAEDGTFDDSFEMTLVIPAPGMLSLAGCAGLAALRRRR